jgi:hypothetical protein
VKPRPTCGHRNAKRGRCCCFAPAHIHAPSVTASAVPLLAAALLATALLAATLLAAALLAATLLAAALLATALLAAALLAAALLAAALLAAALLAAVATALLLTICHGTSSARIISAVAQNRATAFEAGQKTFQYRVSPEDEADAPPDVEG